MTDQSTDDYERANRLGRPLWRFMGKARTQMRKHPWLHAAYKVVVVAVAMIIIVVGLILVPLPGPGWLIVFVGLTVLGTEFHWAKRFTNWLRGQIARFWRWWRNRRSERTLQKRAELL